MKYLMMTFSIVIALVVGGAVVNAVQGQLHAVSQALGQAGRNRRAAAKRDEFKPLDLNRSRGFLAFWDPLPRRSHRATPCSAALYPPEITGAADENRE